MAEKRMFSKKIIDSDAFLDMPLSTQALYFHLSMRADDEGFINNPKKVSRMIGCGEDDLKLLIAKNFIIPFESGVVVIKHWLIHNTIRKDRAKETLYKEERRMINIKENGAYTTSNFGENGNGLPNDNQVTTVCQPNGGIDKISIVENSIDKISIKEEETSKEEETDAAPSPTSLFESFESEFARPLSPIEVQLIADWQKAYSDEIIMLALAEGVKNNARSFRYIEVILNAWKQAGVRNVEEAKMQIEKKQSDKSPKSKISEMPSWYENQDLVQPKGIQVDDEELKKLQEKLGG